MGGCASNLVVGHGHGSKKASPEQLCAERGLDVFLECGSCELLLSKLAANAELDSRFFHGLKLRVCCPFGS